MALMKLCSKCGRSIPVNKKCTCGKYRESNREYDTRKRDKKAYAVYHDRRWPRLIQFVRRLSGGRDLAAFYIFHRLDNGTIVHHIETVQDRPDLAFDVNNLIWVGRKSHDAIHRVYRGSESEKARMQNALKECVRRRGAPGG